MLTPSAKPATAAAVICIVVSAIIATCFFLWPSSEVDDVRISDGSTTLRIDNGRGSPRRIDPSEAGDVEGADDGSYIVDESGAPIEGAVICRVPEPGVDDVRLDDLVSVVTDQLGRFSTRRMSSGNLIVFAPNRRILLFSGRNHRSRYVLQKATAQLLVRSGGTSVMGASVSWRFPIGTVEISGPSSRIDDRGCASIPFPVDILDGSESNGMKGIKVDVAAPGYVAERGVAILNLPRSANAVYAIDLARESAFDLVVENYPRGVKSLSFEILPNASSRTMLSAIVEPCADDRTRGKKRILGVPTFESATVRCVSDEFSVARSLDGLGPIPKINGILSVTLANMGTIEGRVSPPPRESGLWSLILEGPSVLTRELSTLSSRTIQVDADGSFCAPGLEQGIVRLRFSNAALVDFDFDRMSQAYPIPSPFSGERFGQGKRVIAPLSFSRGSLDVALTQENLRPFVLLHAAVLTKVEIAAASNEAKAPADVVVAIYRRPRQHILGQRAAPDRSLLLDSTNRGSIGLPPGNWDFEFDAPGFARMIVSEVSVGAESARVVGTMTFGRKLAVTVLDAEVSTLTYPGVVIQVHAAPGAGPAIAVEDLLESASTDEQGIARFSRLSPGRMVLRIVSGLPDDIGMAIEGRSTALREMEIRIDEKLSDMSLRVQRCGRVSGTVVTDDNVSTRAVFVLSHCVTGSKATVFTDADGRFSTLLAAPGVYEVKNLKRIAGASDRSQASSLPAEAAILEGGRLSTGASDHCIVIKR